MLLRIRVAQVLRRACRACSREQLDSAIGPLLDMLFSDIWRLNVIAAQVHTAHPPFVSRWPYRRTASSANTRVSNAS